MIFNVIVLFLVSNNNRNNNKLFRKHYISKLKNSEKKSFSSLFKATFNGMQSNDPLSHFFFVVVLKGKHNLKFLFQNFFAFDNFGLVSIKLRNNATVHFF